MTLNSIRTRSIGLVAGAAAITTLASTLGHVHQAKSSTQVVPPWAAWTTIGLLIVMAATLTTILWPAQNWNFGASPTVILERVSVGEDINAVRRFIIDKMIEGGKDNAAKTKFRLYGYRCLFVLLFAEVTTLVVAIATS